MADLIDIPEQTKNLDPLSDDEKKLICMLLYDRRDFQPLVQKIRAEHDVPYNYIQDREYDERYDIYVACEIDQDPAEQKKYGAIDMATYTTSLEEIYRHTNVSKLIHTKQMKLFVRRFIEYGIIAHPYEGANIADGDNIIQARGRWYRYRLEEQNGRPVFYLQIHADTKAHDLQGVFETTAFKDAFPEERKKKKYLPDELDIRRAVIEYRDAGLSHMVIVRKIKEDFPPEHADPRRQERMFYEDDVNNHIAAAKRDGWIA